MKSVKKISARLQKKLAGKADVDIQPILAEISAPPTVADSSKPLENRRVSVSDIVEAAKQNDPKAFDKTDAKQVAAIARSILDELNNQIHETEEGVIIVPTIGRFVVRQRIVQKEGQAQVVRKISFHPALKKTEAAV